MKKLLRTVLCGLLAACTLGSTLAASAASAGDYIAWNYAQSKNGGSVTEVGENTVKVTGRGVWNPKVVEDICAITYKEKVPVEGFKAQMTFNLPYGNTAQDGWYGLFLNTKAQALTSTETNTSKAVMVLFKINNGKAARKRVTCELSTVDKKNGIKNIVGTSIIMENLKNDWQVDIEIRGGKLYICDELCHDISTALKSQFSDGKAYPSFMGFAEDYREVSFTVKYDQAPAGSTTAGTTTTKQGGQNDTTAGKTTVTTKKNDQGSVTTAAATGSGSTPVGETTAAATAADPSDVDPVAPVDPTGGPSASESGADATDAPTVPATTASDAKDADGSGSSAGIVIAIVAVVIIGGAAAVILILRGKKAKGGAK